MNRRAAITAMVALVMSACASMRSMKVESESPDTRSYRIEVRNTRNSTVTVSYADGATTRELGTVGAGRRAEFVVVSSSGRITVYATTNAGVRVLNQTVTLTSEMATLTVR